MPDPRTPWDAATRRPLLELTFTLAEYRRRLASYSALASNAGCDTLLLYGSAADDATVRHLTGFSTWWGHSVVVLTPGSDPTLCTSAIAHGEPMHSNIQTTWVEDLRPAASPQAGPSGEWSVAATLEVIPVGSRVGFADRRALPVGLSDEFRRRRPDLSWVDCSDAVRATRSIKSQEELTLMRTLGASVSAALGEGLEVVSSETTEQDVAAAAHAGCVRRGIEAMDFGAFALSGPRSIFKNAWPTARRPRSGEVVVVDLGATLGGYRSDVSRNRFVGPPSPAGRRAATACLEARSEALARVRPGVATTEIISAMNRAIAEHGLAEWDFSLCHGIGMHLVEAPHFHGEPVTLEPGMVFCLEPIVAPPDVGTLCIEDMVAVTDEGYELLTTTPLDPAVVH